MELGGYDLHWVEDPPDDLKCQICLCVARDPQQHPGDDSNPCGKVFCSDCINKHQSKNTNCPNCRKELALFKDRSMYLYQLLNNVCLNIFVYTLIL